MERNSCCARVAARINESSKARLERDAGPMRRRAFNAYAYPHADLLRYRPASKCRSKQLKHPVEDKEQHSEDEWNGCRGKGVDTVVEPLAIRVRNGGRGGALDTCKCIRGGGTIHYNGCQALHIGAWKHNWWLSWLRLQIERNSASQHCWSWPHR